MGRLFRSNHWDFQTSFPSLAALLLLIAIHHCIWICKVQDITTVAKFTFSNSLTKIFASSWWFNAQREYVTITGAQLKCVKVCWSSSFIGLSDLLFNCILKTLVERGISVQWAASFIQHLFLLNKPTETHSILLKVIKVEQELHLLKTLQHRREKTFSEVCTISPPFHALCDVLVWLSLGVIRIIKWQWRKELLWELIVL